MCSRNTEFEPTADSIDVRGDPLSDMSVLTGAFAMKGETVYKRPR